ncbi:hypothetical protein JCM25156A_07960 [Komagataeibacter kakiaceti JCM 25156]
MQFAAPHEIPFRQDAYKLSVRRDHGQATDFVRQHKAQGLRDGFGRFYADGWRCHDVPDLHENVPFFFSEKMRASMCGRNRK